MHIGQLVAVLAEKPSAQCWPDRELLCGSGEKACATCLVNIQPEMANISDLSDISDGELVSATIVLKWAMVYQRSGAGNRHFCNLLARIEDHINMIL